MAVGRLSWMMTLRKMGSTCEVSWRITAMTMDAQMSVICSTSSWMVSATGVYDVASEHSLWQAKGVSGPYPPPCSILGLIPADSFNYTASSSFFAYLAALGAIVAQTGGVY